MTDSSKVLYEGMFLFNTTETGGSLQAALDSLTEILDRAEADVEAMYRWDDRRLAYPIEGQKRGLYIQSYFRSRGTQIPNIERDVTLNEKLLRCLILRADHVGDAELEEARRQAQETRDAAVISSEAESAPAEKPEEPQEAPAVAETVETTETTETAETTGSAEVATGEEEKSTSAE